MKRPLLYSVVVILVLAAGLAVFWLVPRVLEQGAEAATTPIPSPAPDEQGGPGLDGSAGRPAGPGLGTPTVPTTVTPGAVPIGGPSDPEELERQKQEAETSTDVPCADGQGDSSGAGPGGTLACVTPTP